MNPFVARILIVAGCALAALLVAPLIGLAPSSETWIGASFIGGFAGALFAPRLDYGRPTF